MREYNYFCSTSCDSDTSFQQKRYRVFNVEVTKEEYYSIVIKMTCHPLKFDPDEPYETRFATAFRNKWNTFTPKEKQEYLDIPHFNWEVFTFDTGIAQEDIIKI